MPNPKLDPIDRMILAELQADGRMTNVELAKRVGISAPPCLRRVRTLEEQGYIRGYHAEVDARKLGFEVQVFAMVGLVSQAEADLVKFEKRCRDWPLVRECHMLNGEVDFILKCTAPDLSTFQRFLTEELTAADNVASVKTSLVIRDAKSRACPSTCSKRGSTRRTERAARQTCESRPWGGFSFSGRRCRVLCRQAVVRRPARGRGRRLSTWRDARHGPRAGSLRFQHWREPISSNDVCS